MSLEALSSTNTIFGEIHGYYQHLGWLSKYNQLLHFAQMAGLKYDVVCYLHMVSLPEVEFMEIADNGYLTPDHYNFECTLDLIDERLGY